MSIKGAVRRVLTTSAVDGPGNRAVIFLQGCQLNCLYCHNPETIPVADSTQMDPTGVQLSDITDRGTHARKLTDPGFQGWMWVSPEDVYNVIKPYVPFISGVTISGGECTRQGEFLLSLVDLLHAEGIHVILDSNGQMEKPLFEGLNSRVDGWIMDAKSLDPTEYLMLTGIGLEDGNWWENMHKSASSNKLIEVRSVVVPGLLNNYRNIWLMSEWLSRYSPDTRYRIIGFRNHGVVGGLKNAPSPSADQMQELKRLAMRLGVKNVLTV